MERIDSIKLVSVHLYIKSLVIKRCSASGTRLKFWPSLLAPKLVLLKDEAEEEDDDDDEDNDEEEGLDDETDDVDDEAERGESSMVDDS